jgi:hypothetical protein
LVPTKHSKFSPDLGFFSNGNWSNITAEEECMTATISVQDSGTLAIGDSAIRLLEMTDHGGSHGQD